MGTVLCSTSATTTAGGGGVAAFTSSLPLHPELASAAAKRIAATAETERLRMCRIFITKLLRASLRCEIVPAGWSARCSQEAHPRRSPPTGDEEVSNCLEKERRALLTSSQAEETSDSSGSRRLFFFRVWSIEP